MSQIHLLEQYCLNDYKRCLYPPLVCDEGDLEQGGDIQCADEESAGHNVELCEEEDEGGGEGAGQGVQEEQEGDHQYGC